MRPSERAPYVIQKERTPGVILREKNERRILSFPRVQNPAQLDPYGWHYHPLDDLETEPSGVSPTALQRVLYVIQREKSERRILSLRRESSCFTSGNKPYSGNRTKAMERELFTGPKSIMHFQKNGIKTEFRRKVFQRT